MYNRTNLVLINWVALNVFEGWVEIDLVDTLLALENVHWYGHNDVLGQVLLFAHLAIIGDHRSGCHTKWGATVDNVGNSCVEPNAVGVQIVFNQFFNQHTRTVLVKLTPPFQPKGIVTRF